MDVTALGLWPQTPLILLLMGELEATWLTGHPGHLRPTRHPVFQLRAPWDRSSSSMHVVTPRTTAMWADGRCSMKWLALPLI